MAHKKFFLIFAILISSGCMGMMMHGTDHDHNTGKTSEVKAIDTTETTDDSTSKGALQRVSAHETQKPHHEENPKKKNILDIGGIGMVVLMAVMMAAKFIF